MWTRQKYYSGTLVWRSYRSLIWKRRLASPSSCLKSWRSPRLQTSTFRSAPAPTNWLRTSHRNITEYEKYSWKKTLPFPSSMSSFCWPLVAVLYISLQTTHIYTLYMLKLFSYKSDSLRGMLLSCPSLHSSSKIVHFLPVTMISSFLISLVVLELDYVVIPILF